MDYILYYNPNLSIQNGFECANILKVNTLTLRAPIRKNLRCSIRVAFHVNLKLCLLANMFSI